MTVSVNTRHMHFENRYFTYHIKDYATRDNLVITNLLPSISRSFDIWELWQNGQFDAHLFTCWITVVFVT
jgi:hypothetical protein